MHNIAIKLYETPLHIPKLIIFSNFLLKDNIAYFLTYLGYIWSHPDT